MKERPIIMSTDMVKAILSGRKTQTRRVIKFWAEPSHTEEFRETWVKLCRYGQVGDRLWVRETWYTDMVYEDLSPSQLPNEAEIYCASDYYDLGKGSFNSRLRPSIFMPRWASRITLEITEIRVERLQEISEKDAEAEGFSYWEYDNPNAYADCPCTNQFAQYWDKLNAKKGYGWNTNPWIWVISFRRITNGNSETEV